MHYAWYAPGKMKQESQQEAIDTTRASTSINVCIQPQKKTISMNEEDGD